MLSRTLLKNSLIEKRHISTRKNQDKQLFKQDESLLPQNYYFFCCRTNFFEVFKHHSAQLDAIKQQTKTYFLLSIITCLLPYKRLALGGYFCMIATEKNAQSGNSHLKAKNSTPNDAKILPDYAPDNFPLAQQTIFAACFYLCAILIRT